MRQAYWSELVKRLMLRVIADRVAPTAAKAFDEHMLALHHATTIDWKAVVREATEVRRAALELETDTETRSLQPAAAFDCRSRAAGII